MTDPISDLIIRLKNAALAGHTTTSVPYSNMRFAVASKLQEQGFLSEVARRGKKHKKTIEMTLTRSPNGEYSFRNVRRVSTPGKRVYGGVNDLRAVRGGTGVLVVSTPKGILSGDEARKEKVGGELLFEIW